MTDMERVRFLLRPDGEAALETYADAQGFSATGLLTRALGEYGDARLAAAYVLESLCAYQRALPPETPGGDVTSIKIGSIEIKKAAPAPSPSAVTADGFCDRAATLRREHRRAGGQIAWATPRQVPR